MKLLVLGGTRFLGRVFVEQAVSAGHDVTVFNRGLSRPDLFAGDVERLRGDRDHDLSALAGRSFDGVVDPSAFYPRQVRAVVDVLDDIGHYTFVSTVSVYKDNSLVGQDETGRMATVADPTVEEQGPNYGGFKALCEQALEEVLPGRVHHVRAGMIVGRHDPTDRFTYWVSRLAESGEVLAPEPKDQPIQVIDVVDVADWMLRSVVAGVVGVLNAVGQQGEHTMETMLGTIASVLGRTEPLTWVAESFLIDHEVRPFSDLPLWLPPRTLPDAVAFMARSNAKATAAGLTTRPLAKTVADLWSWVQSAEGQARTPTATSGSTVVPGLSQSRERALLEEWHRAG